MKNYVTIGSGGKGDLYIAVTRYPFDWRFRRGGFWNGFANGESFRWLGFALCVGRCRL